MKLSTLAAYAGQEQELYDDLLISYAAGALDHTLSVLVATHLTLSPRGRAIVAAYETVGGALMEKNCAPIAMERDGLSSVLDRLECPKTAARLNPAAAPPPAPAAGSLPQPLCRFLCDAHKTGAKWRRVYPGISLIAIPGKAAEPQALLLRGRPGARGLPHRHAGWEITLVLDGAVHDERGSYRKGDMVVCGADTAHSPVADAREGCLCFVVSDQSFRLRDYLRGLSHFLRRR